jgi:hypothetical protein
MKAVLYSPFNMPGLFMILAFILPESVISQENSKQVTAYEDYSDEVLSPDDAYLATLEEWQNMIDQWLEKPLCLNNEEADWLMEYKIISLFQLNKLKEYRYIYGNLLSVYELSFIDGWDFQTVRKVIPLVTATLPKSSRTIKKFTFRSFRQSLILKTSFNTQKSKGYLNTSSQDNPAGGPIYSGPPVRMALRYDLEYRNRLAFGFRAEKDPGEPFLISSGPGLNNIKTPDLLSGYLHIKKLGPVESVILGNYRLSFGYGVNLSGGQSAIKSRNGMSGMANQVKPQTSVSEAGFYRGATFLARSGRFTFSGFASMQKMDGTSLVTDSLSGKPVSFSTIDRSGLHRTETEMAGRKTISEKAAGGFLVYQNNWLKTGIIAIYNLFNASVTKNTSPYARFGLSGKENLVGGMSATIWLPKMQFFMESSISRNKGFALVSGLQLLPVPGALIVLTHRYFGMDYQNWNGSGFISSGRNAGENGLQVSLRIELARKWLIEFMTDNSQTQWASYGLAAPARQREIKVMAEKAWPDSRSLVFSFRYLNETVNDPDHSFRISHPVNLSQYRFRLEGRIEAMTGVRLKSRIEYNLVQGFHPGFLMFQDIEFPMNKINARIWLRACFFDAIEYECSIYAYENDVLYDFTSFMHYGKGLRGIIMARVSPVEWLDLWLRISTIYYTNKHVGSGMDELAGSRQNEAEAQVRIRL